MNKVVSIRAASIEEAAATVAELLNGTFRPNRCGCCMGVYDVEWGKLFAFIAPTADEGVFSVVTSSVLRTGDVLVPWLLWHLEVPA
jgi:hypothetical protein